MSIIISEITDENIDKCHEIRLECFPSNSAEKIVLQMKKYLEDEDKIVFLAVDKASNVAAGFVEASLKESVKTSIANNFVRVDCCYIRFAYRCYSVQELLLQKVEGWFKKGL